MLFLSNAIKNVKINNNMNLVKKLVIHEIIHIQLVKNSFKLFVMKNDICQIFSFIEINILFISTYTSRFFIKLGKLNQSTHFELYVSIELFIQSVNMFNNNENCFINIGVIEKNNINITINIEKYIIVIHTQSDIFHLLNLFNKGENNTFKNNANHKIINMFNILYINKHIIIKKVSINSFVKKLYSFFFRFNIFCTILKIY